MVATDLKTGKIFKEDGYPYQVVRYEFTKTIQKRGAFATLKKAGII